MKYETLEIDLHPEQFEYQLAGYLSRVKSNEQLGLNEVKLRILWLHAEQSDLVLVSLDVLYFPESIAETIYQFFRERHGINKQNIICNATHTHSAPSMAIPFFGRINPEYMNEIKRRLENELTALGGNLQHCELLFNEVSNSDHSVIGRRKLARDKLFFFTKKRITLLPNPDQEIDDNIRILSVVGKDAKPAALMYNFSCHPVFASNQQISSDFPGLINQQLKQQHRLFPLFLQGYCGDIRPNITTKSIFGGSWKQSLRVLRFGRIFRAGKKNDLDSFSQNMSALISANIHSGTKVDGQFHSQSFTYAFTDQTKSKVETRTIKLFRLNQLVGVSIPAEVLSTYCLFFKAHFPSVCFIPLGFSEGMLGYLPFYQQIPEQGYEVTSTTNYGWDSHLDAHNLQCFAEALVTNITSLLEKGKK